MKPVLVSGTTMMGGALLFRILILIPLSLLLRGLAAIFPPMNSPEAKQRQRELMAEKMARDADHQ